MKRSLRVDFNRFCLVGAAGFVIDAVVLYLATGLLGANYISGRALSFCVAVLATLALNRAWTFDTVRDKPAVRSFLYVLVKVVGGAVGFLAYLGLATSEPMFRQHLIIPLAFGAACGLLVNFAGSRWIAFRTSAPARPRDPE